MRLTSRVRLAGLILVAGLGGPAVATAGSGTIKTGFYAGNEFGSKSVDVEFHVHKGGKVPDLALACYPQDRTLVDGSGSAFVVVHAPALKIDHSGRLRYDGAADVASGGTGQPVVATSTLKLSSQHVKGPTLHRSNSEGDPITLVTAWKGTVSSPVCTSDTLKTVVLYGPVAGA